MSNLMSGYIAYASPEAIVEEAGAANLATEPDSSASASASVSVTVSWSWSWSCSP